MSVISLLNDPEWDFPFFKKLANNDTGAARGHQGGMVIPMDLRPFFPGLSGTTSSINPTIEHHITVWLLVDGRQRGRVQTRYQFQTWGGSRSPESRLTSNLGPLRSQARGGDYLIIQRSLGSLEEYRLMLVRQGVTVHGFLANCILSPCNLPHLAVGRASASRHLWSASRENHNILG